MIKILSETVCNRICAGECIQRPASVVKELVENSIDSGATTIEIRIKEAGKSYIQVIDNGCGIPAEEIYFAFERYSTSKISHISDLDNLSTLGFRGEALASISAVSEIKMRTRIKGSEKGTEYVSRYGSMKRLESISCPLGTDIVVSNLFSNIPWRKRFLKSNRIENQYIISAIRLLALARPNLSISLFIDENQVLNYGSCSYGERLKNIFSESEYAAMSGISCKSNDYELSGFITNPAGNVKQRGINYFIINRRPVVCHALHNAITKAYEQIFPDTLKPAYILNITMPSENVDVNIRPDKGEASLWDQDKIVSLLAESLLSIEYTKPEASAHPDNNFGDERQDCNSSKRVYTPAIQNIDKFKFKEEVAEIVKTNITSCLEDNQSLLICGNDECENRNFIINAIINNSVKSKTEPKIIMLTIDKIHQLYREFEQAGKVADWCQLFLDHDIIVIENIHELGNYPNMLKNIFWIINELMFKRKFIIVSSMHEPEFIPSIEERLRSRLKSFRILSLK